MVGEGVEAMKNPSTLRALIKARGERKNDEVQSRTKTSQANQAGRTQMEGSGSLVAEGVAVHHVTSAAREDAMFGDRQSLILAE
jgi:hypothetical protein